MKSTLFAILLMETKTCIYDKFEPEMMF